MPNKKPLIKIMSKIFTFGFDYIFLETRLILIITVVFLVKVGVVVVVGKTEVVAVEVLVS